jgi:hypothetical protein
VDEIDAESLRDAKAVWCAAFGAAYAGRMLQSANALHSPGKAFTGTVKAAIRRNTAAAKVAKAIADAALLAAVELLP